MKINEINYKWNGNLTKRNGTKYIILHHRAGTGDAQSIHTTHLNNGWSGIGYHFYVRTNGAIERGRPIETVGAHCTGKNSESVGICFEGNYQLDKAMPDAQLKAGKELIKYVRERYPYAEIKGHSDFMATACPGKYFPLETLKSFGKEKMLTSANDITYELSQIIKIDDVKGFVAALDKAKKENTPLYWGFYKIVNKIS